MDPNQNLNSIVWIKTKFWFNYGRPYSIARSGLAQHIGFKFIVVQFRQKLQVGFYAIAALICYLLPRSIKEKRNEKGDVKITDIR